MWERKDSLICRVRIKVANICIGRLLHAFENIHSPNRAQSEICLKSRKIKIITNVTQAIAYRRDDGCETH
jgi:hypothetical protein